MAYLPPQPIGPGMVLHDRYEIRRELRDAGGSRVFRGLDLRMGREVRIRVFPLSQPSEADPFQHFDQRTLALAPLHHPNIQSFFDAGMVRREGFTIMEWLEGETLQDRLARTGPLSWEEARPVILGIASALAYAHAHDVTHLRLTPEAVFLPLEEGVKLRDFAHAPEDALPGGTPGGSALDLEQFAALTNLAVKPGEVPVAVKEGLQRLHLGDAHHEFRELLKTLAAPSEPLRPPRSNLRWFLALGLGLAVLPLGFLVRRVLQSPTPTLRILPVESDAPEAADGPLRSQIPDQFTHSLRRWHGVRVVAFDLPGVRPDFELAPRLSHAQGALLLDLTLRRISDGHTLWQRTLPFSSQGVAALQSDLQHQLGRATGQPAGEVDPAWSRGRTTVMPAFHAYMRGRHFMATRTPESLKKAEAAYGEAIQLDPAFALAHAALGECYALMGVQGLFPPQEALDRASAAAERALALDPMEAEAHCTLAYVRFRYAWDWQGAEVAFRKAVALDPDNPLIQHWYGFFLSCLGRFEPSIEALRKAVDLDPLAAQAATNLGVAYVWSGQVDRGLAELRKVMDLDPRFLSARDRLIGALESSGRTQEALAERLSKALIDPPGAPEAQALQRAFNRGGVQAYREQLERIAQQPDRRMGNPFELAYAAAALGHSDLAFEALNRAVDTRFPLCVWIPKDPALAPLRQDPRFQALLRRLNFPEK